MLIEGALTQCAVKRHEGYGLPFLAEVAVAWTRVVNALSFQLSIIEDTIAAAVAMCFSMALVADDAKLLSIGDL